MTPPSPEAASERDTPARAARRATLARLAHERFDLLVIGGGITGAGVARDAAMRGLRVALVERDDFASGTSSRSSRLVHGGVRYLEHGALHLVFESSRERRTLLRIAPHLVRPLRFTWPVYRGARIPRWKLGAGLTLYDALSLFRNVGRHRRLGADGVIAAEPALAREGLVGGAQYYDAATDDARLTLETVLAARDAGAAVLNHASAISLLHDAAGGGVSGGVVRDALSGQTVRVSARAVVSAAGPWTDEVLALHEGAHAPTVRGTKGVHIEVPRSRVGHQGALTLLAPGDGRVMFVLPAGTDHDRTIIGTTDTPTDASPAHVRARREDVRYLLEAANAYFPAARLCERDVISAWAGIRPLAASGYAGAPASASREHAIARVGPGLLAVTGGKLTTYRTMAAEVVDHVARELEVRLPRSRTAEVPLPGGAIADLASERARAEAIVGDAAIATRLVDAHGSAWRDVWSLVDSEPRLGERLDPALPFARAELAHAASHEMAWTLADLLVRRVPAAFATRDHAATLAAAAAATVASRLGWSDARAAAEVERYAGEAERIFTVEP